MIDIKIYSSLIFDCDGVVLKSNHIKSEAFRLASLPWGKEASEALVAHHVANGGISRYQKFAYFVDSILPSYLPLAVPGVDGPSINQMLQTYSFHLREEMIKCTAAENLETLRSATDGSTWSIVSGSDQNELRELFASRGLHTLFDGGIYGSPDNKDLILSRLMKTQVIQHPAVFFGDSIYDREAAIRAGIEFVFVSDWTEVAEWRTFVKDNNVYTIRRLKDLL